MRSILCLLLSLSCFFANNNAFFIPHVGPGISVTTNKVFNTSNTNTITLTVSSFNDVLYYDAWSNYTYYYRQNLPIAGIYVTTRKNGVIVGAQTFISPSAASVIVGDHNETNFIYSISNPDGEYSLEVLAVDDGELPVQIPTETLSVTLDKTPPTSTLTYSNTAPTNLSVTATLTANEAINITNNGGNNSYVFTNNGAFTFNFTDLAGNTASKIATVANIDKAPPNAFSIDSVLAGNDIAITVGNIDGTTHYRYQVDLGSIVDSTSNTGYPISRKIKITNFRLIPGPHQVLIYTRDSWANWTATARRVIVGGEAVVMDSLTLTYKGNKLNKVRDTVSQKVLPYDFDSNGTTSQYSYDRNGNVTKDLNRFITSISYSSQNLPLVMLLDTSKQKYAKVEYEYDYSGARITKRLYDKKLKKLEENYYIRNKQGQTILELDSLRRIKYEMIYGGSELLGQRYYSYSTATSTTVISKDDYYFVKDHLGNVRVTLKDDKIAKSAQVRSLQWTAVSATNYYDFGAEMKPNAKSGSNDLNKYEYQSKERDIETNYDYFEHRYYDSGIARFLQPDPHGEKYRSITTYNSMFNNPIRIIDPTGMDGEDSNDPNKKEDVTNNPGQNTLSSIPLVGETVNRIADATAQANVQNHLDAASNFYSNSGSLTVSANAKFENVGGSIQLGPGKLSGEVNAVKITGTIDINNDSKSKGTLTALSVSGSYELGSSKGSASVGIVTATADKTGVSNNWFPRSGNIENSKVGLNNNFNIGLNTNVGPLSIGISANVVNMVKGAGEVLKATANAAVNYLRNK